MRTKIIWICSLVEFGSDELRAGATPCVELASQLALVIIEQQNSVRIHRQDAALPRGVPPSGGFQHCPRLGVLEQAMAQGRDALVLLRLPVLLHPIWNAIWMVLTFFDVALELLYAAVPRTTFVLAAHDEIAQEPLCRDVLVKMLI